MSDPSAIILGMKEKWIKYSYVCPSCDSLIEFTIQDTWIPMSKVTCVCGGNAVQVSVEDATIQPSTNERNQMETVDYLKSRIAELEDTVSRQNSALTTHQNCDYWKSENGRVQSQIIDVIDEIYAGEWTDESDIAKSLCQIIDYTPVKTINFSGSISFSGSIDVPMEELDSFDLHSFLQDELSLDSGYGDMVLDSYEVDNVEED